MKQNRYVKITNMDPAQGKRYRVEAEETGLSLGAYLLQLIEEARAARKAKEQS
jgi:hypothetical protein